jgi:hypothetical protein
VAITRFACPLLRAPRLGALLVMRPIRQEVPNQHHAKRGGSELENLARRQCRQCRHSLQVAGAAGLATLTSSVQCKCSANPVWEGLGSGSRCSAEDLPEVRVQRINPDFFKRGNLLVVFFQFASPLSFSEPHGRRHRKSGALPRSFPTAPVHSRSATSSRPGVVWGCPIGSARPALST